MSEGHHHILAYRNISWEETPFTSAIENATCPPDLLREHLELLSNHGRLTDFASPEEIPEGRSFSLLFLGGFRATLDYALPILEEFGIKAGFSLYLETIASRKLAWPFRVSALQHVGGLNKWLETLSLTDPTLLKSKILTEPTQRAYLKLDELFELHVKADLAEDAMRLFLSRDEARKLIDVGWKVAHQGLSLNEVADTYTEADNLFLQKFGSQADFWCLDSLQSNYVKLSSPEKPLIASDRRENKTPESTFMEVPVVAAQELLSRIDSRIINDKI